METFDLVRIAEYEPLSAKISACGSVRKVLEVDTNKVEHIARHSRLPEETLRFRKPHHSDC